MNSSELNVQLCQLWPEWYRRILDYQEICQSEQEELDALAQAIHAVADNFFFQSMDQGAVEQWEAIFGIVADPAREDLAFRRARLLNRISTKPPFTLGFLYQKLDELIGPGEWTVNVDYPNYTLYIESSAEDQAYASEVAYTIGKIKPAHIAYINTPYLRSGVLVSESVSMSRLTWNYALGSWGLGVSPFADEQDMGVIKMPTTASLTAALLGATADFLSGDVASARINGTQTVSELSKSVEGSTLTFTYPVSGVDAVTQVELLDGSGTVLSSSTVYVPVTGSTIMKHIIPVAEGVVNSGQ